MKKLDTFIEVGGILINATRLESILVDENTNKLTYNFIGGDQVFQTCMNREMMYNNYNNVVKYVRGKDLIRWNPFTGSDDKKKK